MEIPRHLNVAVVPKPHLFHIGLTEGNVVNIIGGMEKDFLELLASVMKFRYSILYPLDGEWGVLNENGTWSGVIGLVATGKADIGLGRISITEQRMQVVDYSYPYTIEDLTFATAVPLLRSKALSFVFPFQFSVWILIFAHVIIMSVSLSLVLKHRCSYGQAIFYIFGYILGQPINIKTETISERITIILWMFGMMMISIAYSTVLLSFMTIPIVDAGIKDITQLSKAVASGDIKCFTFDGAAYLNSFLNSKHKGLIMIGNKIKENQWFLEANATIITAALSDHKSAMIAPRNFLASDSFTETLVSDDAFYFMTRAIVLSKFFCCKAEVNRMISRINAAGLYQKIINDQSYYVRYLDDSQMVGSTKPLTLSDLSGVFILLFLGYVLSILCLIIEASYDKMKRNASGMRKFKSEKMSSRERKIRKKGADEQFIYHITTDKKH